MSNRKSRVFELDVYRALLCLAVLFYHLNILKGGYLAVCGFFVLSGFLSAKSLTRKLSRDNFEGLSENDRLAGKTVPLPKLILRHYLERIKRVYLPLVCICFITLAAVCFFPDLIWISLKPETISVLGGYNNFWQIEANLDYFARHLDSPFMHLWYIGILLQFELVFPILFLIIRKKPRVISGILCIVSLGAFIYMSQSCSTMTVYYSSLSRCFSLFMGIFAYFLLAAKKPSISLPVYLLLLIASILSFIFIDASSVLFVPAMIAVSLISCVICGCSVKTKMPQKKSIEAAIIGFISSISYEIYLVQYPVIFFCQQLKLFSSGEEIDYTGIGIVLLFTLVIAAFLSYALKIFNSFKGKRKPELIRSFAAVLVIIACVFGGFKFASEEDHTAEMKALEAQLAEDALLMEKRQQELASKMAEEQAAWEAKLKEFKEGKEGLKNIVKDVPVTCIGDSVMLGASKALGESFTSCYCDAAVSRSIWVMPGILRDIIENGSLGSIVVVHAGTNGEGPDWLKDELMKVCEGKEVFWLTITNDYSGETNMRIKALADRYENAHIIDWNELSQNHPEYFGGDKIHLTHEGQQFYAQAVFDAIYNYYLEIYQAEINVLISAQQEYLNSKYTLVGDELLMSLLQNKSFSEKYPAAITKGKADLNFEDIKGLLASASSDGTLTNNIVIAMYEDQLTASDYEYIVNTYSDAGADDGSGSSLTPSSTGEDSGYGLGMESGSVSGLSRNFMFVTIKDADDLKSVSSHDNVKLIQFETNLSQHPEYLHSDHIHLTDEGLLKLTEKILSGK